MRRLEADGQLSVRLAAGTAETPDGLTGALEVVARDSDGGERLIGRQPLDGAATEEQVADRLAEALSVALSRHRGAKVIQ